MPTAFVTGGTGFVGSHLVEELLRRGYGEVRCLVRSRRKWLEGLDVTIVKATLADVDVLWEALEGVDYVFHVGGITRARDWATFEKNNVTATLDLLGAVHQSTPDVRKVLLTSSLAAVGRCASDVATEEVPLRPVSRYGRSKAAMEKAVRAPRNAGRSYTEALPLVIVRPPVVYGPRDRDVLRFFQTVKRGICPVAGSRLSFVHARDLARGMVDCAEAEDTGGETYFLGSEQAYAWPEIKRAATEALGTRAVTLPVPGPLVSAVGAAVEGMGRLVGRYPPLNREKAREIRQACTICSVEKAKRDFGYRQEISLNEGVRETIAWYRREGWL